MLLFTSTDLGVQLYGPFIAFCHPAFDPECCFRSSFEAIFSSSVDSNQRPSSPFGTFWKQQIPGSGGPTPGSPGTGPVIPRVTSPREDNICKVLNSEVLLDWNRNFASARAKLNSVELAHKLYLENTHRVSLFLEIRHFLFPQGARISKLT